MNAKTCKELRKTARAITVGRPERQLVQYRQQANPVYDPVAEKMVPRHAVCAVNMPGTTRAVYREMKTGRTIDPKRIVREKQKQPQQTATFTTSPVEQKIAKESFVQKAKTWFRKFINNKFR